jgi:hypothetical protein
MLAFRCEVHQYADDHYVRDLKQDVPHADDQMMDDQKIYVLGDLLLDALRDHCVALMYVVYRMLVWLNENVRILELQYFHQLAFQRAALKF